MATPGALERLTAADIEDNLRRHAGGDWGDVCPEDRHMNDEALRRGCRLLSVYQSSGGTTFWIITEADRSSTTILLPGDY